MSMAKNLKKKDANQFIVQDFHFLTQVTICFYELNFDLMIDYSSKVNSFHFRLM